MKRRDFLKGSFAAGVIAVVGPQAKNDLDSKSDTIELNAREEDCVPSLRSEYGNDAIYGDDMEGFIDDVLCDVCDCNDWSNFRYECMNRNCVAFSEPKAVYIKYDENGRIIEKRKRGWIFIHPLCYCQSNRQITVAASSSQTIATGRCVQ